MQVPLLIAAGRAIRFLSTVVAHLLPFTHYLAVISSVQILSFSKGAAFILQFSTRLYHDAIALHTTVRHITIQN